MGVTGSDGWVWGIVALVLAILEVVAPGFFLIFLAAGAAVTGLAAAAQPLSLEPQLAIFAAASLVAAGAGVRFYRQFLRGRQRGMLNTSARLIGARGTVEDAIRDGRGKVRLGDTVWLATGSELERGAAVEVVEVTGTVLSVRRVLHS